MDSSDQDNSPEAADDRPAEPIRPEEQLYPAFLVLRGKTCVVIGGGRVAARKVRALKQTGATLVVVSPRLHEELQTELARGTIRSISTVYSPTLLTGATLVFAATDDPELNRRVTQDAQALGMWVNTADTPEQGDFFVPATIRQQNLTLAISTAGTAPAFARYLRERLEAFLAGSPGQALALIAQTRPAILAAPATEQAGLWNSLLALQLEAVIQTDGLAHARVLLENWRAQNLAESSETVAISEHENHLERD